MENRKSWIARKTDGDGEDKNMELFPAIDLRGGKAVRLVQGDYNQMTVFSDRPEEVALGLKRRAQKSACSRSGRRERCGAGKF